MKPNLLNEYQAASLIGMSPELLRYLVKYQIKWKDTRKLTVAKEVGGTLYFEESELKAYDAWLRAPWPAKDNKRPTLPTAIREEIRVEAKLECALCRSSGQAGEAAHIDPINTSKSNHPHNLIWLCANHHTKFDNGCFGPKGADNQIIAALKQGLQHFKRTAWQGQAEIAKQIAATLSLCGAMQKQLSQVTNKVEVDAVERIAKKALEQLPKLALQAHSPAVKPILIRLSNKLAVGKAQQGSSTRRQLETAASFEEEFLLKSGLVQCPLCKGSKSHNGYDCPVCFGNGAVDKNLEVDLTEFEFVECQLCNGTRSHNYGDCPACGGEGEMERRIADRLDFSQFKLVKCQLCNGTRSHNYEECPACSGEGKMERRIADRLDFSQFEIDKCPLCKGKGKRNGDDCPACHGNGQMQRRAAERLDVADFKDIDCPLCKGVGHYNGDECPACHGNRTMEKRYAEQVDVSKYEVQQCPICKGRGQYLGDDCHPCNGEGLISVSAAEQLDVSDYDSITCPRCEGKGVVDGDECGICEGTRKVLRWRLRYI